MKKILYMFMMLILGTTLFTSCSVVPITGRKAFNIAGDQQVLALSQQQYHQFLSQHRVITKGAMRAKALNIAERLAQVTTTYLQNNNYGDLAHELHWEFNVVQSNQINAFCMPGGKIVIYTGLIKMIGNGPHSDAELAAVIGHEIGHAIARHANERMSNSMLLNLGGSLIGIASARQSELLRSIIGYSYGIGSQLFVALPFSRRQEYEADRIGLSLMAMAGYNPRDAILLWKKMEANSQSANELLSTHPSDNHRIEAIEKYLPEALKFYHPHY